MNFLFFLFAFILFVICLQNRQVMVTFLGRSCRSGRRAPQSPNCSSSCNVWGKMRECGEDDDIEGVWGVGGRDVEVHKG